MKTNLLFAIALCLCFAGCSEPENTTDLDPSLPPDMVAETTESHAHPEHGPHEGELIELGMEDYHAEMVHGADGISIYLLDSAATTTVPIASDKLVISLKHDGAVKTFDLAATPEAADPDGQSCRFVSADAELHQWLDDGAVGAITVEIDGKSFTGRVAHDHEGHDHEGHDH